VTGNGYKTLEAVTGAVEQPFTIRLSPRRFRRSLRPLGDRRPERAALQ